MSATVDHAPETMAKRTHEIALQFHDALKEHDPHFAKFFVRLSQDVVPCGGCPAALFDDVSRARGFGPECFDKGPRADADLAEIAAALVDRDDSPEAARLAGAEAAMLASEREPRELAKALVATRRKAVSDINGAFTKGLRNAMKKRWAGKR